jgi:hypothetical protein
MKVDTDFTDTERTLTAREYAVLVLQSKLAEASRMRRSIGNTTMQEHFQIQEVLSVFTEPYHVLWVNNKHGYVAFSDNWMIFEDVACYRADMKRIQV